MNRTSFSVLGFGGLFLVVFSLLTQGNWIHEIVALAVTTITILFLIPLAPALNLIDVPQGHKTHTGPVPVVGGIAMFIGIAAGLLTTSLPPETIAALLTACGLLVIVGALDDRLHLPVRVRFIAQVGAALIMIEWGGVRLNDLGQLVSDETFTLGRWSVLMTVVATVGVINSMNMADGLDGLAGTLALVTLAVTALLAFGAHVELSEVALISCSALIAFLAFNGPLPGRHPGARIFMGDAGSMMLGLLVAWLMIALSQGPERVFPPVTALWLFALPLLDTLTVMLRRILRGRSPFSPDREHLHHVLIVAGYSKRMVVVIAAGTALLFAGLGLAMLHLGIPDYVQFFIALGVFGLINLAVRRAWRLQRWLHRT